MLIKNNNNNNRHITDTHYDFMYIEGGDEDKQCREVTYKSKYEKGGASSIGNYKCDTSFELLQSSFEYMVKHEEKPDFIIWTGDVCIQHIFFFIIFKNLYVYLFYFLKNNK